MDQPEHQNSEPEDPSQNIHLEDSDSNMNEDEQALFLNIRKSRSNDSFLGKFIGKTDIEKRPLVLDISEFCQPNHTLNLNQNGGFPAPPNLSIFKKVKKEKKHNKCDYQKNICGYITKKIIREFIGPTFQDYVENLCKKYQCDSEEARKFYLSKVQYVTGPSHVPILLQPQGNDNQQIKKVKYAFRQFFEWFLKERYLRYLMLEGKMNDKKAYIEYKNNMLFGFLQENKSQIDRDIRRLFFDRQEEKRLNEETHHKKSLSRTRSRDKNIILTQRIQ